jgi:hypoxanthine phosphoribosyltransferase
LSSLKKELRRHKHLYRVARQIRHPLYRETNWHLVTYDECFSLAAQWSDMLPKDFDVIIGIPRGGLMVANVIACKLGKPLSTPNDFIQGNIWFSQAPKVLSPQKYRKVLLVEDNVGVGRQIHKDAQMLKDFDPSLEIKLGSLFATKEFPDSVDYHMAYTRKGLTWENTMMTSFNCDGNIAVDLDGVLCKDENPEEPLYIPSFTVKAVITGRLEDERDQTETWLKNNNVHYKELIMYEGTAASRTQRAVSKYKAEHIIDLNASLFWESDVMQAAYIANMASVPVYCPKAQRIISPKVMSL